LKKADYLKAFNKISADLNKGGWRFFDEWYGQATIRTIQGYNVTKDDIDKFVDESLDPLEYQLTDDIGTPVGALEIILNNRNPLENQDQIHNLAQSLNVRYGIFTNGEKHYIWDLDVAKLYEIHDIPSLNSVLSGSIDVMHEIEPSSGNISQSKNKEKVEDGNALWAIADDMRDRKDNGEFKTYRDAYRWAAEHYTHEGKAIKAHQLEREFHKARSSAKVD